MPPHLLLLLTLLGPGGALWLREHADKAAPHPLPARVRRQVTLDEDYDDQDYDWDATDPPETLDNHTRAVVAEPELLTTQGPLQQRASAGPGTPEPTLVGAAAGPSAGLGAGGTATEGPSTELATPRMPVTGKLAPELASVMAPSTRGAPPMEGTVMEDLSRGPAATEAGTTPSVATEAETTQPVATEAETTQPVATEAETTQPVATEAETTPSAATMAETIAPVVTEAETTPSVATEAETIAPVATEAETTLPLATEALSMKPVVMEAASTEPFIAKSLSIENTTAATFLVTYKGAAVTTSNLKSSEVIFPGSSAATSPSGAVDLIPVKQCLLAILVLALVATIFFVCTVVLAVRLSRKTHTYPVRSYSPTEMVCISALLPEGTEGVPATANGGLPKSRGLKAEAGDHDGDDLTLHSFLP